MKERGRKFMVGLVMAGATLGLLLLNPGLSQAEEWETLVDDTRLTFATGGSADPNMVVDGSSNIHIAWWDYRDGGRREIYYKKLDDNGNTIVGDTRLTHTGDWDDPYPDAKPGLGVDNAGNIHIAWSDYRNSQWEIYYTKLDNNGNTLVDDTRITNVTAWSRVPSLGVDSVGNIHIAFHDYRDGGDAEIYYTKLDNNGDTVVEDTRLTTDPDGIYNEIGHSYNPRLGVDSADNIHIVWQDSRDDGNREIYYTKLDNNGNTLVNDTRLTSDNANSHHPDLKVDSAGNIHIAWPDDRDGNLEVYYTKLDNNGNTLVDDTRLTSDSGDSWRPSLGVDSTDNIHIAWRDDRDFGDVYDEIYYTKLDNNGNTVVDDTRLTYDGADSELPSLVVDSTDNIHIVWQDSRHGYPNWEIYYTKGRTVSYEGIISGFVTEADYFPIARARVKLFQGNTLVDSTHTDVYGHYEFGSLADGKYVLKARKRSYGPDKKVGRVQQARPWGKQEFINFILSTD